LLLALTATFLIARMGLQSFVTANPRTDVAWNVIKVGNEAKKWRAVTKPQLYFFSASWWPACQQFESTALSNRMVSYLIQKEFVPVKVVDDRGPTGNPSRAVERLRKHFSANLLPTLVVADSDGRRVSIKEGEANSLSTYQFLRDSLTRYKTNQYMDALPEAESSVLGPATGSPNKEGKVDEE
jgi:hypothetical protein